MRSILKVLNCITPCNLPRREHGSTELELSSLSQFTFHIGDTTCADNTARDAVSRTFFYFLFCAEQF